MYYIVDTQKKFEDAVKDLEISVKNNGFGVLHIHNLGNTLRNKGLDFSEECNVFEVCNPYQAANVLAIDMRLNMALPCRISVYTDKGHVKIGYIKPVEMLSALSSDTSLTSVANEVEQAMITMVNEAK
jgi:uncharacterized protein (DUF302 family)